MKRKIFVWLLVFWAVISAVQDRHCAYAADSAETYAISLVNQIRHDPLGYAEGLGYDRNVLLEQLPWLWMSGAANGLAAVTASEVLTQRAKNKNTDDIIGDLIVTIIEDNSNGETQTGVVTMNTDYAAQGDISGVVSFTNFMKPDVAIKVVINNQFKRELNPDYNGKHILLSPEYKLIGVSFCSGNIQQESGVVNAYLIYITLSSALLKSEVQIVNMINQLRDNPAQAYNYLSLDLSFLSGGYSPMFFHDALDATAKIVLYDEVDVQAHALDLGFPQPVVGYTAVTETFTVTDRDTLAMGIFSSLLIREVAACPARDTIFSPLWNEVGAGLYKADNASYNSVKLAMVTGQSGDSTNGLSRIYGMAYVDEDLNGVYTPGEEAVERPVTAYDSSTGVKLQTVVTNKAGQFSFRLPGNVEYNIETINKGIRTGRLVFLNNDLYLSLSVQQDVQ